MLHAVLNQRQTRGKQKQGKAAQSHSISGPEATLLTFKSSLGADCTFVGSCFSSREQHATPRPFSLTQSTRGSSRQVPLADLVRDLSSSARFRAAGSRARLPRRKVGLLEILSMSYKKEKCLNDGCTVQKKQLTSSLRPHPERPEMKICSSCRLHIASARNKALTSSTIADAAAAKATESQGAAVAGNHTFAGLLVATSSPVGELLSSGEEPHCILIDFLRFTGENDVSSREDASSVLRVLLSIWLQVQIPAAHRLFPCMPEGSTFE